MAFVSNHLSTYLLEVAELYFGLSWSTPFAYGSNVSDGEVADATRNNRSYTGLELPSNKLQDSRFPIGYHNSSESVLCWQCNSAIDPRCGEHDFDQHTLDQVDCSQLRRDNLPGLEAAHCRKIVQHIQGKTRTVRGCGWIVDDKYPVGECYTRTGTKDIQLIYCHCEGDGCNPGNTVVASMGLAAMLVVLIKLF
ncbi:UPAR/Ly6 domain-containing protein crok-like [Palaemon carinicauda]|uniref:UPAR/Ly6 domain-containing protein crok-like n=1 Tax=Palaemon carinicauda TaxID=392227 RepID=UPI0035B61A8E